MKCHYCSGEAKQYVSWLQNKRGESVPLGKIKLPHCGCDLYEALRRFWPNPYMVYENVNYKFLPLE